MSGGSLTGVGEVIVSDLFVWEAGTIEDEKGAKIKVEKDFQLSTAGTKVLKRQLIMNGNATWVSTGMDISIDGRLTISEAASLRVIGHDFTLDATSYGRGILDNYGVFDVEMPFGAFHVDVEFNNYGSFVITSGDVKLTEKSDIRGILKFRDFSSTIHVMDGKHTIRPHSSSEDRLGKLKVENGFAEAIDCDWQEVMVAGNADVNMKYVSFTKPVIKSLSMEDGKTTVTSLSGSKIRLKNIVNDGGNIVLVNPVIATNVTMRGGVLETQNKMEIVGQFNWMAGTLRGGHLGQAQIVSNNELILIGSRDKILEDETFVVASAGSWKCAGDILMKRSTFVVRPTSNLLITGAGSIEDSEGTNVVWIKGSMELTSHTSLTLNTRFINDGIVTVSDGVY
ncbi:uncharacterized protein [Ptychodera flava]|uniref:uncharacterized protein n=1 Tax=Ptychodera flava TaxID=63121 RepID=UPI00396A4160